MLLIVKSQTALVAVWKDIKIPCDRTAQRNSVVVD